MRVAILRIGEVDADVVRRVRDGLCKAFPDTECAVLDDVIALPKEAYNVTRKQHNSTIILSRIIDYVKNVSAQIDRVLSVVDADLYVPRLNFVFGEAECPGKTAIISLFRLKPQFYGRSEDRELFFERSLKEAVHELGHTLGLGHCRNPLCIMFFSNSIQDTDRKRAEFCEKCMKEVLNALRRPE